MHFTNNKIQMIVNVIVVLHLQNTDGRKGDGSGRTKNSLQSSVQNVKAQRNPEEVRKQRVITQKFFPDSYFRWHR